MTDIHREDMIIHNYYSHSALLHCKLTFVIHVRGYHASTNYPR